MDYSFKSVYIYIYTRALKYNPLGRSLYIFSLRFYNILLSNCIAALVSKVVFGTFFIFIIFFTVELKINDVHYILRRLLY